MKVLFHGYNICCQTDSGGVQNRIKSICSQLNQREGFEAQLFNPYEIKIKDYDILHLFKLNYENYDLIKFAKCLGKKVVLSSIVSLEESKAIRFFGALPFGHLLKIRYNSAHLVDRIITETPQEASFIEKNYRIPVERLTVIPNGIAIRHYEGREIFEKIGNVDKYAIVVGRFDDNKNQLNVIKALKGTGVHVVFMGGPAAWSSNYYNECIQYAGDDSHFHFLGWIDYGSELFMSALSHADTLIFPSFQETFGLVAIEAGALGCKLAMSETLPILDFNSFKQCARFDPSSIESIKQCVLSVIGNSEHSNIVELITNEFSWDKVINQHIDVYQNLLK